MRLYPFWASTFLAVLSLVPGARACELVVTTCVPPLAIFPAYTHEGVRIGTVEARVRTFAPLERSRSTGQPITVVFNNPGSFPGAVDPDLRLVPLPRVKPFKTQAVYPRGY